MNKFSANFSSSPPSTPDIRGGGDGGSNSRNSNAYPNSQSALFGKLTGHSSNPSTTPAGPPPGFGSSAASFTPANLPPSSSVVDPFGSSKYSGMGTSMGGVTGGTGISKLRFTQNAFADSMLSQTPLELPQSSTTAAAAAASAKTSVTNMPRKSAPLPMPPRTKNGTPAFTKSRDFFSQLGSTTGRAALSTGSRTANVVQEEEDEGQDGEHKEEEEGYDGFGSSMLSNKDAGRLGEPGFRGFTSINNNTFGLRNSMFRQSAPMGQPAAQRRVANKRPNFTKKLSQLPRKGKEDVIPTIARALAARQEVAPLTESDEVILETEDILVKKAAAVDNERELTVVERRISASAQALVSLWRKTVRPGTASPSAGMIGPNENATGFEMGNYLASLLLPIHHPALLHGPPSDAVWSTSLISLSQMATKPIPQVLLEWLDEYHFSYTEMLHTVRSATPNCAASEIFWDAVQSLVLRGKLADAMQLLADADFRFAASALDEGVKQVGYQGAQLQTVQSVVSRLRQLLDGCPGAVKNGADWNVAGADWDLFRKRVSGELEYLARLADGVDDEDDEQDDGDDADDAFHAENFGLRRRNQRGGLLGKATASAAHRASMASIPFVVFQSLKVVYAILLGSADEIITQSQDWLEGSLTLAIWWDGATEEGDAIANWSRRVGRSQVGGRQSLDDPYLERLSASFLCVTDPDDRNSFQINTMSTLEVGLGAILQGDIQGALTTTRTFSLCIAAAVAEVASAAGWMDSPAPSGKEQAGLNDDDLMVLSYGVDATAAHGVTKDDILFAYAEALFSHPGDIENSTKSGEGWELALTLTTRFDDQAKLASTTASDILDSVSITTPERLDRLVGLCANLGYEPQARVVCERFGDELIHVSGRYGLALLCYARSHSAAKVRQVADLLISYCLVQSTAYPPDDGLDEHLRMLVAGSPRAALAGLANYLDAPAAEELRFALVGYACVRRMYCLRDEAIVARRRGELPKARPHARKRAAAHALIAAVNSAADAIYGGLYDPERQSAVQVDALMTLCGEATAFFAADAHGHGDGSWTDIPQQRTFSSAQLYALLAAVEDLESVNRRVYSASEECLLAALRNFHGSAPPNPHDMFRKSTSSASNAAATASTSGANSTFSFSLMGSEMLARSASELDDEHESATGGLSVGSSAVLVGRRTAGAGADAGTGKAKPTAAADGLERGWDWRALFAQRGVTGADVLTFLRRSIARELGPAELEEMDCASAAT